MPAATLTTSLSAEAQEAADEVISQRNRARAKVARPAIEKRRLEIERLKPEAAAAAHAWLKKHRALSGAEQHLNAFLALG